MAFEVFEGRGRKAAVTPRVSVSKTGLISVNRACRERFLADTEAVQLLFDADSGQVGIRPVDKDAEHAYAFRTGKTGGQVSGTAFLKHYGIDHAKTATYDADWDDTVNAVVFAVKTRQP